MKAGKEIMESQLAKSMQNSMQRGRDDVGI